MLTTMTIFQWMMKKRMRKKMLKELFGRLYRGFKKSSSEGKKAGSRWLIIDDVYILHKKQTSTNGTFWDCSGRQH